MKTITFERKNKMKEIEIKRDEFLEKKLAQLAAKTGYTVEFLRNEWIGIREGSSAEFVDDYTFFEQITLEKFW